MSKHSDQTASHVKVGIPKTVEFYKEAEMVIIKHARKEAFSQEIECLGTGLNLSKQSSIIVLSPFLDSSSALRVGGRLNKIKGLLPK